MTPVEHIAMDVGQARNDRRQISGDSSSPSHGWSGLRMRAVKEGCVLRQTRTALSVIATLMGLMLVLFTTGAGVASAQEGQTGEKRFVKDAVSNVNAYWEEQFGLMGLPYSPAKVVFIYNDLVDSPCGLFYTRLGPAYCSLDETLYYPLRWHLDGRTLDDYGDPAVEWAVAHELAHHAQAQLERLGVQGIDATPGVEVELEADCLAGVYANRALTSPRDLKAALSAIGESGGPGHGTSQQRSEAFELGYATGSPAQCFAIGDAPNDATPNDATPNDAAPSEPSSPSEPATTTAPTAGPAVGCQELYKDPTTYCLVDKYGEITLPDGTKARVVVDPSGTVSKVNEDGTISRIGTGASFMVDDNSTNSADLGVPPVGDHPEEQPLLTHRESTP
jgi:uncharacterized protein